MAFFVTDKIMRWVGPTVVLFAGLVVILPSPFGREVFNAFWKFTFEFQTMITGVFAVGAAYVTLRQMAASDERSDRNHLQTIRLAVRRDVLKIERLIKPQLAQIRFQYQNLTDVMRWTTFPIQGHERDIFVVGLERYRQFQPIVIEISDILARPVWDEAKELFDGTMNYDLSELHHAIRAWGSAVGVIGLFSSQFETPSFDEARVHFAVQDEQKREQLTNAACSTWSEIAKIHDALEPVIKGLYALKDEYSEAGVPKHL